MEIRFYSDFGKKKNSTKIPAVTDIPEVITGELKAPCDILNPVVRLSRRPLDAVPDYCYAYIPVFSRYYFVSNIGWSGGFWEISMEADVLGSWRTDIGNMSCYVTRSASDFTETIIDTQYPVTTDFVTGAVNMSSTYIGKTPTDGCYVLGIVGNANYSASQAGGAVTYYCMTSAQMESLMHYLLSDGFLNNNGFPQQMTATQQLAQDTAKALINPLQYIVSCTWFPVPYTVLSTGSPVGIVLGYWDLGSNHAQGYKMDAVMYSELVYAQMPPHPQAETRGSYLNHAPYTRATISLPPFGSIPIDLSFINAGDYIICEIKVDPVTGKACLRVQKSANSSVPAHSPIITEASAMFGIPIQLAQMTPDYLKSGATLITAGVGAVSAAASGNVGGAITTAANGVGNALSSVFPQARIEGVSGSFTQNTITPKLTIQYFNIVEEDNEQFGRPLCETVQLDTLEGYIQCGEAHVDFPCLSPEHDMISEYLLNGFFWE